MVYRKRKSIVAKYRMGEITTPNHLDKIGMYVRYKDKTYVIVRALGDGLQLYSPLIEGAQSKQLVSFRKVTLLNKRATPVRYKGRGYLVTPKGCIISLETCTAVNWSEDYWMRKSILSIAGF